jgi:hypothetical protein
MANRTSSITAALKLSGQAEFKSGLSQIGMEANKLGKTLREMKPITFDGGANQAKKAWALTEEHQRAHHRVMERQAKLNKGRMEALGLGGAGGAGSTRARGGGGGSSYGLGVGYNAIQDLVQGGPAAIANNIPQIVEMVSKSPKLQKGLAGAAAVASLGYGIKEVMDAYQRHGSVTAESARMAEGRGMVRNQFQAVEQSNRVAEAQITGTSQAKRIAEIDAHSRKVRSADNQEHQASLRKMGMLETLRLEKISTGVDEVKVIKETAASQIAFIDNQTKIEENYSNTAMRLAEERKTQAIQLAKEAEAELFAIQQGNRRAGTSASDAELVRQAELEKTAPAMQARADAAKQEYDAAVARVAAAKEERETAKISKDLIKLKEDADLKSAKAAETAANNQRELNRFQTRVNATQEEGRRQYDREQAEKTRTETTTDLTEREKMSKMSPRALSKYQEKKRIKASTDEFIKQGFSPDEAEKMAGRENQLAKDNDPSRPKRIRGAGYAGGKGEAMGGLGSATYGGLEDLESMQPPSGRERKTISGAGNKDKEKKSGVNDKPDNLYQVMVKGFAEVVKAVLESGPNAADRAKPTTSTK